MPTTTSFHDEICPLPVANVPDSAATTSIIRIAVPAPK